MAASFRRHPGETWRERLRRGITPYDHNDHQARIIIAFNQKGKKKLLAE
jgi:hypothetical protein